jgi:hypothetical protein
MMTFVSRILLFIFIIPAVFNITIIVDYTLRYKTYAEVLCENKDMPEFHCNGKCQLLKMQCADTPMEPSMPKAVSFAFDAVLSGSNPFSLNNQCKKINYTNYENPSISIPVFDIPTLPPKI